MTTRPSRAWVEPLLALALACLLLGPALAPGYVLSYDMVWVPDLALRPDVLGLGSSLPRAVPSDALVAVLDEVLPGWLLQKLMLVGLLVAAGLGASRLVPGLPLAGRLTCLTVYQWNAFVVERLVIGHWPVLVGYAVLPWVLVLGRRWRATRRLPAALPLLVCLGSLSAGAGLVTALALVVSAATRDPRRGLTVIALVAAGNAPWLVSGLLHVGSASTDAASAAAFALSDEGPLPGPLAALTLGGIWNAEVVPATRESIFGVLALAAVVVVVVGGARAWWRTGRSEVVRIAVPAAVGLAIAIGTWAGPDVVGGLIEQVPGSGVLRDGARLLALLAPALAALSGCAVAALSDRVGTDSRTWVAAGCALVPLVLLPDAAVGVSGHLHAVEFPSTYTEARKAVAEEVAAGQVGDALLLPFTSYRQPGWNRDTKILDPTGRFLTPDALVSDELVVADGTDRDTVLAGEDPRAGRARDALALRTPEERAAALAELGVGFVVVDEDTSGEVPEVAGRTLLGPDGGPARLSVVVLDDARERTVPGGWVAWMSIAWGAFLAAALVSPATVLLLGRRRSVVRGRHRRSRAS